MALRTLRARLAVVLVVVAASLGAVAAPAAASPQPPLSSSSRPTNFHWNSATLDVPWTAARLPDGSRCGGGRLTFAPIGLDDTSWGSATRGRFTYEVRGLGFADVNRDGSVDQLVEFACSKTGTDVGFNYYYVYSFTGKHLYRTHYSFRPFVRDYVTSADFAASAKWAVLDIRVRTGAVDVTQWVRGKRGVTVHRTFRWHPRRGLIANRPLPFHPEADVAPR
ncbi:hypothetical protein [Cryptosporangium phraense]|uniref:VCBS repeat-containing protein n=1 Tax=Cryptosporangium phraense TaxID=2593070 RepID=A0A545ARY4_9ACTN|nr:hypothetical protein [Cryptosporangium phraense]TQS44087.1 hypothetical protein FL583_16705 [Cryptosporangium phraense]